MSLDEPTPDVVVTKPDINDQLMRITLFKSEDDDGALDISNIGGMFGLGPPLEVDGKHNRGFARKVIADVRAPFRSYNFKCTNVGVYWQAFGGVRAGYFHNFGDPKPGQTAKIPL
jgi:hypothetical protein